MVEALAPETPVDPHQQLYSEVLALRKELIVVQEDEERLRNQLGNTKLHKAALKPEVAEELKLVEEEATSSTLKGVWEKQLQEQPPEKMDWSTIDISNLHKRTKAARKVFLKAKKKADTLLSKQDKVVTKNADSCEATKAKLKAAYDEEMANLKEARERLTQIEKEESFHQRRGTNRGRAPPVSADKVQAAKHKSKTAMEERTSMQLAKLKEEHHDLTEELKKIQNQIKVSNRMAKAQEKKLNDELKTIEDEGKEANEVHSKLTEEAKRINKLREDMNRVLLYVRAKNKIE